MVQTTALEAPADEIQPDGVTHDSAQLRVVALYEHIPPETTV